VSVVLEVIYIETQKPIAAGKRFGISAMMATILLSGLLMKTRLCTES
jgi:hypothetical protein